MSCFTVDGSLYTIMDEVGSEDSASQTSRSSQLSVTAKRAALKLTMEKLQKQRDYERQRFEYEQRKIESEQAQRELEYKREQEATELKLKALELDVELAASSENSVNSSIFTASISDCSSHHTSTQQEVLSSPWIKDSGSIMVTNNGDAARSMPACYTNEGRVADSVNAFSNNVLRKDAMSSLNMSVDNQFVQSAYCENNLNSDYVSKYVEETVSHVNNERLSSRISTCLGDIKGDSTVSEPNMRRTYSQSVHARNVRGPDVNTNPFIHSHTYSAHEPLPSPRYDTNPFLQSPFSSGMHSNHELSHPRYNTNPFINNPTVPQGNSNTECAYEHDFHQPNFENVGQSHEKGHTELVPNHINPFFPSVSHSAVSATSDMSQIIDSIRLSAITVPSFDGKPSNYATFINSFDGTIGKANVDNQYKLTKLLEACKGKALDVIQHCAVMHQKDGYPEARWLLEKRFGDPYVISSDYISKITKASQIQKNDHDALQDYADQVSRAVATMSSLRQLSRLDTEENLLKLSLRLPDELQRKWKGIALDFKENNRVYPGVELFKNFLNKSATRENDPLLGKLGRSNIRERTLVSERHGKTFATASTVEASKKLVCYICGEKHKGSECDKLKAMRPSDRLDLVKKRRLCYNCLLYTNHVAAKCNLPNGCESCTYKHAALLHEALAGSKIRKVENGHEKSINQRAENSENVELKAEEIKTSCSVQRFESSVALPIVPVLVRKDESSEPITTLALLDTGSDLTLCSSSLIKKLDIKNKVSKKLSIDTVNTLFREKVDVVSFECMGITKKKQVINLDNVNVLKEFPKFSGHCISKHDVQQWDHLKSIPFIESNDEVELIIGQDYPKALIPLEVKQGISGPYAVRTALGWSINGPINGSTKESIHNCNFMHEVKLDNLVEKFWQMDSYVGEDKMSFEDRRVMDVWNNTIKHVDGHYELEIPFREEPPKFDDNKSIAVNRLNGLKRRFSKNPDLHQRYKAEIDTLVTKSFAERVNEVHQSKDKTPHWYIPHHNVVNENKPEKTRIVFDCAAEFKGTSLNKQVMQGPDLTNKLVGVLLRFRQYPVAMMSDIEGMYHQVKVPDYQRNALRFLWWEDGDVNKPIQIYRMKSHLFGGIWSPSCAAFALKHAAVDFRNEIDEETIFTINNNFYVDDCLKSMRSVHEATQLVKELCTVLAKVGFRLTKWISNNTEVMKSIPPSEYAKEAKNLNLDLDKLPVERALGVHWDPNNDEFIVNVKLKEQIYTRRGLLRTIGSIYDPLGFVSPVVLNLKKIFQDECRRQKTWDDELELCNKSKLDDWIKNLEEIKKLRIPRCMVPTEFIEIQIHIFADASSQAYGAVAYLLVKSEDISVSFMMSKSKLAPMSAVTIPRLELSAAVTAVKLGKLVEKELSLNNTFYWTDSLIVLQYIRNKTKRFQTFVANRLAKIHEMSAVSQWKYIPGKDNPADIASRGIGADKIIFSNMWLQGPQFLKMGEDNWPNQPEISEILSDDKEVKKSFVMSSAESNPLRLLFDKYSNFHKLCKAVAWLQKFIKWIKREDSLEKKISVEDMKRAEMAVISVVQSCSFSSEMMDLKKGKCLSKSSGIYQLNPRLSNQGILEVQSRVNGLNPIILPQRDHVASLIVHHYHEQSAHSGCEYVLSQIQKKYWIPRARKLIKSISSRCFKCKKLRQKPATQQMAELPEYRIKSGETAFEKIGVDCFGPYYVKKGRSREKRYGCIFTCLCIRAIHLEKLESLEASTFINAFRRFSARRGVPELIKCDNGTNFVGAANELHDYFLKNNIKVEFITPTASHMGGVWERMIKETKKVLNGLLDSQPLTDEALNTLFCEVENIINNRPLTHVSEDPNDIHALTPNDLLLVKGKLDAPGMFVKRDIYKKQWRQVQYLADQFWKRWQEQYLKTLQLRQKWLHVKRNMKAGDIVLLVNEQLPRQQWELGRVTESFQSQDGLVRSVQVKTARTQLKRPITKLCLLEAAIDE